MKKLARRRALTRQTLAKLAVAVPLLFPARGAFAAESEAERGAGAQLGADVAFAASATPLGLGFGGFVTGDHWRTKHFACTWRAGAIAYPEHIGIDGSGRFRASGFDLAALGGAKLWAFRRGPYLSLEAGAVYVKQTFWQPIGESPFVSSSFDPAAAIGLGIELGPLDVRAGAIAALPFVKEGAGDLSFLATTGLKFGAF